MDKKKVAVSKRITKITKTTITLNAKDIRELLQAPATARVTFQVPSGGDYSGDKLNLTERSNAMDSIVEVMWEQVETEG